MRFCTRWARDALWLSLYARGDRTMVTIGVDVRAGDGDDAKILRFRIFGRARVRKA